jgi:hypothetical protein
VQIDDPSKIPYRATPQGEPLFSPNVAAITRALRAGIAVPGCSLVTKRSVS